MDFLLGMIIIFSRVIMAGSLGRSMIARLMAISSIGYNILTDYTPIGVMHAHEPPLMPNGVSTAILLALWHRLHSKEREAIALASCL